MHTHTHTHTHTHRQRGKDERTETHRDTQTRRHTETHRDTQRHTETHILQHTTTRTDTNTHAKQHVKDFIVCTVSQLDAHTQREREEVREHRDTHGQHTNTTNNKVERDFICLLNGRTHAHPSAPARAGS
jgi:hypothetical protein